MTTALGNYLRKARKAHGMTVRRVAEISKKIATWPTESFSHAYLVELEAGRIKNPSPLKLWTLSRIYRADPREMLMFAAAGSRELLSVLDALNIVLGEPELERDTGQQATSPDTGTKWRLRRPRLTPFEIRAWLDVIDELKQKNGGEAVIRLIEEALRAFGVEPPSDRIKKQETKS